ncbi:MAG TPA: hypothetical protein ENI05_12245 [Porticoccus sp.]|nr:hypothetical protein [Porticoccus sp.]
MRKLFSFLVPLALCLLHVPANATTGDLGWAIQSDLEGFYRQDIGPLSPDEEPVCDVTYTTGTYTNWATVLASFGGNDVVCLDPGDYTGGGELVLDAGDSGASAANPNILWCTQGLTPWAETAGNRCKIETVDGDFIDNFAIMGMEITNAGAAVNLVTITQDSDNFSLVANYIHDGGRNLVSWGRGSDNGLIQDNVICEGELIGTGGTERHVLFVTAGNDQANVTLQGALNLAIISNEMCNAPGDIIQLHPGTAQGVALKAGTTFAGLRIIGNELYFTDTRYTLVDGTYNTGGDFMGAENCIDTKMILPRGDAPTEAEKAIIAYNICHGTRKTASVAFDNLSSTGTGFFHQRDQSSWAYIYGNIFYDTVAGIGTEDNFRDVKIDRNAWFNVAIQDEGTKGVFSPDNDIGSVGITFDGNHIFSTDAGCSILPGPVVPAWLKHAASKVETMTLNTIVNGCEIHTLNGGNLTTTTCGDNYYFGVGATGSAQDGKALVENEAGITCTGAPDIDDNTVPASQDFKFDRFRKTGRATVTITSGFLTRDTAPTVP